MNKHFTHSGRINRAEYWLGVSLITIISIFLLIVAYFLIPPSGNDFEFILFWMIICTLTLGWPMFCLNAKRMHDYNVSAWWSVFALAFLPLAIVLLLINGSVSGTQGLNDYGSDPNA